MIVHKFNSVSPLIQKELHEYKGLLYFELKFSNYLKIRIKCSKNQAYKFKRYDKIPCLLPEDKKTLSNIGYMQFGFKSLKNKGFSKIKIGGNVYIHKVGYDVDDIPKLNNMIKNFILNN